MNRFATVAALAISAAWLVACKSAQAGPNFMDAVPSSSSTTIPEKIHDDYWYSQFVRVNKEVAQAKDAQVVFFGDSITKAWTLLNAKGKPVWEKRFAKYNPINMGNSGGITPTMLYRATHGNLDFPEGQDPRVAVLLCGTNNYVVTQSHGGEVKWDLGMKSEPREVADGVRAIAQAFRAKLPSTRVIVLGILPVKQQAKWVKCQETNRILAGYAYPNDEVVFLDLQDHFIDPQGQLKPGLFTDGTHLTTEG
ncbi:MAG: GDSL-type esterase/lipase family protein, partial [Verrucomicrobiales bacterium]